MPQFRRIFTFALALLTLAALLSPFSAGRVNAAESIKGQLGGSKASFDERFGTGSGSSSKGITYQAPGYSFILVKFDKDRAKDIVVKPEAASWTSADALVAIRDFLPGDGKLDETARDTGDGRFELACSSSTLGKTFSAADFKRLKHKGKSSECYILESPDSPTTLSAIEISIGRAGSLDRPTPPTPTPTADEIKASYPPLADVRELAIRPGGMYGDKIVFSGTILTIHVAAPGYILILGDAKPSDYGAAIQVTVAAPDGSTEVVVVGYDGDTTGMFEGSYITVYGTVVDTFTGTNAFGGSITQPLISGVFVDLS